MIGARTVKLVTLVPAPSGPVTVTGPLAAPVGTAAVISASEMTANDAATPPKVTEVAPAKPAPVTLTTVPGKPLRGRKAATLGAGVTGSHRTTKSVALVAAPPTVVTAIGPVVAPAGTHTVISAAESAVNRDAATPRNVTDRTRTKPAPFTVTVAPGAPEAGEKPATDTAGGTKV